MNIGKAIKMCRTQKDMRQAELAVLADISVAYLSLIEQGKRDPNFSVLKAISKGLDIPLSILVFLATDNSELSEINPELFEKLSVTALNLVKASADEAASL
jgi:transcriptional regulator with XRE-family HTH domain